MYITSAVAAQLAAESIALSRKRTATLAARLRCFSTVSAVQDPCSGLNGIYALQSGCPVVTAEIDALVQLFPQKLPALCWREGEDADFVSVPAQLVRLGYVRGYEVETKGTFALRGDILDIYPVNAENPVRVDFFGDTVERIKPYDLVTGERLGKRKLSLPPPTCLSANGMGKRRR
ncbi:MAG: hypothetical protein ACLS4Z_09765 [Christensenellaceae bacterium]